MADGDKNAPIFDELFGRETGKATNPSDTNRGEGSVGGLPMEIGSIRPPLHQMHEARLVRNAGRMMSGRTVPAPDGAEERHLQIFSAGEPDRNGGSALLRTAVAMTCLFALGSAGALTGILRARDQASAPVQATEAGIAATNNAADLVPDPEPGENEERVMIGIAQAPVTRQRIAPPALALPPGGVVPGFIRVAQKDAPELIANNIFGPAGKPIRLPVSLKNTNSEEYSFLMFRGLPAKVTLSAGFRLKESWAVSLRDIDNLSLETPADYQGAFNLEILLIKGRDTPAESRIIAVEIVSQDIKLPPSAALNQVAPGPQILTAAPRTPIEPERPPVVVRPQAAPQQPARATRLTIPAADEQVMMQRAEALLENKDVSSARLLFEHLARSGSARAALAMGKTFDPAYLKTIEAAGLKADVEKARGWYRQAAELGDQEASNRLAGLATR
jgi:hypothetical protein